MNEAEGAAPPLGTAPTKIAPPASNPIGFQSSSGGAEESPNGIVFARPTALWNARPLLRHIHDFARARSVAPLAVLGSVLTRAVASTPPGYVLPPLVGGVGSLNLYAALVGESGGGKGAADATGQDAVRLLTGPADGPLVEWADPISGDELYTADVGSGEGLIHAFAQWNKGSKDNPGRIEQIRSCVQFTVPEIDHLAAVGNRLGATLLPMLRKAWSGEALNPQYVDPIKRVRVDRHTYRCALLAGVQPGRAGALLDDSDGGTPQRFIWLPTTDERAPDQPPPEPLPRKVRIPLPPAGRYVIAVCGEARDEIVGARRAQLRGVRRVTELDGHELYAREKVAAGLAILDGHLVSEGITAEDWWLAKMIMVESNATRLAVENHRRAEAAEANKVKAEAEATREQVKHDRLEQNVNERLMDAVLRYLRRTPGQWTPEGFIRQNMDSRYRPALKQALAILQANGEIEIKEWVYNNRPGLQLRVKP